MVQLKIMDYSLLLGIHEAGRPAPEEEEDGEEEEGGGGGCDEGGGTAGSYGTSPEGIGAYFNCHRPPGPGEFDPTIDVYAIRSAEGEGWGGGRSAIGGCGGVWGLGGGFGMEGVVAIGDSPKGLGWGFGGGGSRCRGLG